MHLKNTIYKLSRILPDKSGIRLIGLGFLVIVGSSLEVLGISLIFPLITVLSDTSSELAQKISEIKNDMIFFENIDLETFLLTAFVLIFFFKNLFLFGLNLFTNSINVFFVSSLSSKLLERYLNNNYTFFSNSTSSSLARNIINESTIIIKHILTPLIYLFLDLFIFLGLTFIILFIEKNNIILISLSLATIILIFFQFSKKYIKKLGQIRLNLSEHVIRSINEIFHNIKIIKIFSKENYFKNYFSKNFLKLLNVEKKKKYN